MSVKKINPPLKFSANAHVKNMDQYKKEYNESIADRNAFWAKKAERISWVKKWDSVGEFAQPEISQDYWDFVCETTEPKIANRPKTGKKPPLWYCH